MEEHGDGVLYVLYHGDKCLGVVSFPRIGVSSVDMPDMVIAGIRSSILEAAHHAFAQMQ